MSTRCHVCPEVLALGWQFPTRMAPRCVCSTLLRTPGCLVLDQNAVSCLQRAEICRAAQASALQGGPTGRDGSDVTCCPSVVVTHKSVMATRSYLFSHPVDHVTWAQGAGWGRWWGAAIGPHVCQARPGSLGSAPTPTPSPGWRLVRVGQAETGANCPPKQLREPAKSDCHNYDSDSCQALESALWVASL